jgi:hypothetical protein
MPWHPWHPYWICHCPSVRGLPEMLGEGRRWSTM